MFKWDKKLTEKTDIKLSYSFDLMNAHFLYRQWHSGQHVVLQLEITGLIIIDAV